MAENNGTGEGQAQGGAGGQAGGEGQNNGQQNGGQQAAPKQELPDFNKIIEDKVKTVKADVTKDVTTKIVTSLTGGEGKKENPIHTKFLDDPENFLLGFAKSVQKSTIDLVNASNSAEKAATSAMNEVTDEYPELTNVRNEIAAELGNIDDKLPISERVKQAGKNVAKRMGWKSKAEKENDKNVKGATLTPTGNIYASDKPHEQDAIKTLNESAGTMMSGRKAQFAKLRNLPTGKSAA